jgi:ribosomal protein S3AE
VAEKKKFIDVKVPILQKEISVLGTPKELNKRTIKLDLSRKLKGKGVMITLEIFNLENQELFAIPKRIELIKSYIRRIIRKKSDNIEDSFSCQCSDLKVIVKPFLITRKNVSRVVRKNLRNTAREFLINYLKEVDYNTACNQLLNGIIQKEMLPRLKKVYPLAFCDIRIFETKELDKIEFDNIIKQKEENKKETQENEDNLTNEDLREEKLEDKEESENQDNKEEDKDNEEDLISEDNEELKEDKEEDKEEKKEKKKEKKIKKVKTTSKK